MTIVYFALGEDMDMYCQAYLSILSFLKQTEPGDRVVVVTSNTDFFRHFDRPTCVICNFHSRDILKRVVI